MFFRFLLRILKPSNELLRRRSHSWFEKARIVLYRFLLNCLLKAYSHYAIFDTIIIDGGKIKIVHEYRDLEFENELIRNKIEFKPKMSVVPFPIVERKSSTKRHFGYFKFNNLLSVSVGNNKLYVNHDNCHSIDGTAECKVKHNLGGNNMTQTIIEILSKPTMPAPQKEKRSPSPNKGENPKNKITDKPSAGVKKPSKNIFGRDREVPIPPIMTKPDTLPATAVGDTSPRKIEKRGFDIDTTF